jgi:hypothetical protein
VLRFLGSGGDILVPTELLSASMIGPRRFQPRLFFNRAKVPIISFFEFAFNLKPVFKGRDRADAPCFAIFDRRDCAVF